MVWRVGAGCRRIPAVPPALHRPSYPTPRRCRPRRPSGRPRGNGTVRSHWRSNDRHHRIRSKAGTLRIMVYLPRSCTMPSEPRQGDTDNHDRLCRGPCVATSKPPRRRSTMIEDVPASPATPSGSAHKPGQPQPLSPASGGLVLVRDGLSAWTRVGQGPERRRMVRHPCRGRLPHGCRPLPRFRPPDPLTGRPPARSGHNLTGSFGSGNT